MSEETVEEKKTIANDDETYRDELPEDLDITRAQATYEMPTMMRRRGYAIAAWVLAALLATLWFVYGEGVFVNAGFAALAAGFTIGGIAMWLMGWPLHVREHRAIEIAAAEVDFAVGHMAAQLGWQGVRSRPTWRVLLYSYENPPKTRAVVLVDAVDGHVVFSESEPNPEDWSMLSVELPA